MAKTLVYQLYPIAWEQYGKGKKALVRMTKHLKRIKALGADYVWLSLIYPSPRCDHGRDICDYKMLDPRFGDYADLARFISTAHDLGLKVVFDLVLNHTSTEHPWFKSHPEYYCWSDTDKEGWHNLFNGGPAWQSTHDGRYYLHLFTKGQADLNWFPSGGRNINMALVHEFREIIDFWQDIYHVDGFGLDFLQAINKDLTLDTLDLTDLLFSDGKDIDVINALFEDRSNTFLIMECLDPTEGDLIEHYYWETKQIDYVLDASFKGEIRKSQEEFERLCEHPVFMVGLESYNSARFLARYDLMPEDMIWRVFNSRAKAVCMYQGQELCLRTDTCEPIPLDEYEKQEKNPSSYLNLTKAWIKKWKGE